LVPNETARQTFNDWRSVWRKEQKQYNDKTGFINRVPDHVLKIAMCLSLSRYDHDGTIIDSDIREAIEQIVNLTYASQKASEGGSGLDILAAQTKRVVDYLISATDNQLTRNELLVRGYGDYDPIVLDKIIDHLMEMKWVKRQKLGVGANMDWLIVLSGEPKSRYDAFRAQNNGRME